MRLLIIAIVMAVTTATGSATVHVSAADKARAAHVRECFSRELANAKLQGATYDLAVKDKLVAISQRHVELTVELRIAISDRDGRLISVARASANTSGSRTAVASLLDQATTKAIQVAVERVRATR
jgi:phage I-like protein